MEDCLHCARRNSGNAAADKEDMVPALTVLTL